MKLIRLIKRNAIVFSSAVMMLLIALNVVIIIYNNYVLEKATNVRLQNEKVKNVITLLWNDVVRNLDLGLRGYAINKEDGMLGPYNDAHEIYDEKIKELETLLDEEGYDNKKDLKEIDAGVHTYFRVCEVMLELAKKDSIEAFRRELKKDKGFDLWKVFDKNTGKINKYGEELSMKAEENYKAANKSTLYLQIILAIIGLPTLAFIIIRIRKDSRERQTLFMELDKNNREYLFNPGTIKEVVDEREIINHSIENLKSAANFVNQISKGNFGVEWEQLTEDNKDFNKNNLTGELLQMREKMKNLKSEDERRIWTSEGLATLSEVIRKHQHDLTSLCYEVLIYAIKYLNAQQGGLFLVRGEVEEEAYLELKACYAFNRKKFLKKRIEAGDGLIGQIYLEKESMMYVDIPQGYTLITSGLGDETPNCLVIVPMKYNEKVEAIIEIASFNRYEQYQIDFLEKVGDIMASTLGAVKNNEKTQELLEQFKLQTEQLKNQEEELKQNLEEMAATQEAARRAEQDLD